MPLGLYPGHLVPQICLEALVLFSLLALVPLRESPIATIIIIQICLLPRESTYINSMYLELMILRRGLVCCDSWGRKESDMTE